MIVGDVSQACVHAPVDQIPCTRIPETLGGLTVNVDGAERVLHAGEWVQLLMALHGFRKHHNFGRTILLNKLSSAKPCR